MREKTYILRSSLAFSLLFSLYALVVALIPPLNLGLLVASPLNWLDLGVNTFTWWMGFLVLPSLSFFLVGSFVGAMFPLRNLDKKTLVIHSLIRFVLCTFFMFVIGLFTLIFQF